MHPSSALQRMSSIIDRLIVGAVTAAVVLKALKPSDSTQAVDAVRSANCCSTVTACDLWGSLGQTSWAGTGGISGDCISSCPTEAAPCFYDVIVCGVDLDRAVRVNEASLHYRLQDCFGLISKSPC